MKRILTVFAGLILSLNVLASEATGFVKDNSQKVLALVKESKDVKVFKDNVSKNIVVDDLIDFKKISQLTLGKNWRSASEQEREEFQKEFSKLLFNFYSNAMYGFKDASINYGREMIDGDEARIKTEVSYTESGVKKKAKVDYVLHKVDNKWKIVDVVIEGITLTLSYKEGFNKVINEKGMKGLIEEIKQKNIKNA